ncbi:hypothetical protein ACFX2I_046049 [Malus domestica]
MQMTGQQEAALSRLTGSKQPRKGKKTWRANISTDDIHDFFEQSTKDASGGSLAYASVESLFFEVLRRQVQRSFDEEED